MGRTSWKLSTRVTLFGRHRKEMYLLDCTPRSEDVYSEVDLHYPRSKGKNRLQKPSDTDTPRQKTAEDDIVARMTSANSPRSCEVKSFTIDLKTSGYREVLAEFNLGQSWSNSLMNVKYLTVSSSQTDPATLSAKQKRFVAASSRSPFAAVFVLTRGWRWVLLPEYLSNPTREPWQHIFTRQMVGTQHLLGHPVGEPQLVCSLGH